MTEHQIKLRITLPADTPPDDVIYHATTIKRLIEDVYPDGIVDAETGNTVWKPLYDWSVKA